MALIFTTFHFNDVDKSIDIICNIEKKYTVILYTFGPRPASNFFDDLPIQVQKGRGPIVWSLAWWAV